MKLTKFFTLGMILMLLMAMAIPFAAQEGEGGTIVESNIGDDPSTFNPVIGNDATSSTVYGWMYPTIIGSDDVTLEAAPNVAGALATGWEYDETGTVLTVSLREDAFWSDGTQITADDYLWTFNAVKSGETSSPRTYVFYELDNGDIVDGYIHSATKVDDFTIEFRLGSVERDENGEAVLDADGNPALVANCLAIDDINDISVVPSHVFEAEFGDNYASMDEDPYFIPATDAGFATFGPFTDPFLEFGVQVSLIADQNYPDTQLGYVAPGEWLLQQVEDTTVEYERFLAGDFTTIGISPDKQNGIRGDERFQFIEYPANGYTYMGFNLADPANPQPGRGEDGEVLDQGNHPIFGDVRVRQAIAHGVDVLEMIGTRPDGDTPATGILEGNGYPQATHNHPGLSSVDPGVEPYPFDQALAAELLDEAGWMDEDGDGIRECVSCLYAETGTPLEFELLTNAGNNLREATGETIRAQLEDIGIRVNFQAIEFGTLVDELLGQEFDAIIIGWSLGLPFTPDMKSFFGIGNDRPGAGFNFVSYSNEELEVLDNEAGSIPGCDQEARNELYAEVLRTLHADLPYLWLYAGNVMVATQSNVENFDPLPYNTQWNIDAWTVND